MALCSHTVAAAESNGELQQFMDWYSKTRAKQPVNMTPLALEGMPAGAGRKGGRVARKKVRGSLVLSDENRVPHNSGRGGVNAPSHVMTELPSPRSCVTQSGPLSSIQSNQPVPSLQPSPSLHPSNLARLSIPPT